jgi:hypothetical protein
MVADPRAAEYIRSQLNAGFRIEKIEKAMLDAGWKEQQVEEAIDSVLEEQGEEGRMAPAGAGPPVAGKPLLPGFPAPVQPRAKEAQKDVPQKQEPGLSPVYIVGTGLALAGGAAVLKEYIPSLMPDLFSMLADSLSFASFSALLGDAAAAGIISMVLGLAVFVMAVLMAAMRDSRVFFAPAILVLSILLLFNGFVIGSFLGIIGAVLGLLSR